MSSKKKIVVTRHTRLRALERLGWQQSQFENNLDIAFRLGIKKTTCPKRLKPSLHKKIFNLGSRATDYRLYNRIVYIFRYNTLLTVYEIDDKEKNIFNIIIELENEDSIENEEKSNKKNAYGFSEELYEKLTVLNEKISRNKMVRNKSRKRKENLKKKNLVEVLKQATAYKHER